MDLRLICRTGLHSPAPLLPVLSTALSPLHIITFADITTGYTSTSLPQGPRESRSDAGKQIKIDQSRAISKNPHQSDISTTIERFRRTAIGLATRKEENMSEAAEQDIIPGDSVVAPNPEETPAAHEAEDAVHILAADPNGPGVLVSQLWCVTQVELK
jgi:hypothetical protein